MDPSGGVRHGGNTGGAAVCFAGVRGRLVLRIGALGMTAVMLAALATLWSPWALTGLAAAGALVVGLVTWPFRGPRLRGLSSAGLVGLMVLAGARVVVADQGEHLQARPLPGPAQGRVVDRLLEEQDIVLSAAPLLGSLRLVPRGEGEGLTRALRTEYARMRAAEGAAPSPFVSTVLGLDGPESFDLLLHEARGPRTGLAVVFLHGYGGSFALPCWEVAAAAAEVGVETACPSVGREGDWWTPRGERIVQKTVRWMRARGANQVVLAGLSNGGIGASRLAPRLGRQIAGLVLLSGAAPVAPPRGLPVLVVHGRQDRMTSAAVATRYARAAGRRGTLVLLPGDHFVLVHRAPEIQARLTAWLAARIPA